MYKNCKTEASFLEDMPSKVLIGIKDGYCNLRCPICFMHSEDKNNRSGIIRGGMSTENLCKILDEIKETRSSITPNRWSEPLLIENIKEKISSIKKRKLPLIINTNGLLLTKDIAEFFVDIGLDSITFSIDAVTKDTLKKIRGTDKLKRIKDAVFLMLDTRKDSTFPRIGVSFTLGEANRHERDRFVSYWLNHVDVVRVNKMYDFNFIIKGLVVAEKRKPCYLLYNSMTIDCNGDVTICCLDALSRTNMGNVFKDGVRGVWHGEKFARFRYFHETGQYDKSPLCRDCNQWANYTFNEIDENGILIRKSPIMTFYNRIDRLHTWNGGRVTVNSKLLI